jgi:transporter family-2 protein
MSWTYLIPIAIGFASIFQGGVNRNMSNDIGLAHSILIGNIIIVAYSLTLYFWVQKSPETFPEFMRVKASIMTFKWWYIFPSICGFIIVAGIPYGIFKLGAVKVTVIIVAAQMLASILWDTFIEKSPVNLYKSLGLFFAGISVALTLLG